ncbi:hypothetical protein FDA94_00935 [Herbidospora galbida]|uniref:Uncharacterized protein n=1 Tax=Herbidospora galbida TaxID=2575442 RepID=A0A4U3MP72_9ACTN|nr:hypothetical protein [Herbidospora galbida]TKK91395.1 hypothetical protein FDA94_00935 [Herbidospora galbida]
MAFKKKKRTKEKSRSTNTKTSASKHHRSSGQLDSEGDSEQGVGGLPPSKAKEPRFATPQAKPRVISTADNDNVNDGGSGGASDPELLSLAAWEYTDLVNEMAEDNAFAQRIKAKLGVNDLLSVDGMVAWLSQIQDITADSWADDIVTKTMGLPLSVRDTAGIALARIFGIEDGSWNEVLANAMVDHHSTYDTATNEVVTEMIVATGGDMEGFERALGRRVLFGDPSAEFTAPDRTGHDKIVQAVRRQIDVLIKRERESTGGTIAARRALPADLKRQRQLDRLAWVLFNLKTTRECVAVAVSKLEDVHLFANRPDADMDTDFFRLISAAEGAANQMAQETSALYDEMVAGGLEVRKGGIRPDQLARAERRLRKTISFLSQMQQDWKNMQVVAHVGHYDAPPDETKVHAETRAADAAYRQRKEELRAVQTDGGLSEAEREIRIEAIKRRIREAEIAIGISKLCCFHCWRMLKTMNDDGLPLTASGTHFRTYAWPAGEALTDPEILTAFLGLNEKANPSKDERLLLEAVKTPEGRNAVITGITTSATGGGDHQTGYDSSGDEADDAPPLTLWQAKVPPGTQLKAPPKKKATVKRPRPTDSGTSVQKKVKIEFQPKPAPAPYVNPNATGMGLNTRSRTKSATNPK